MTNSVRLLTVTALFVLSGCGLHEAEEEEQEPSTYYNQPTGYSFTEEEFTKDVSDLTQSYSAMKITDDLDESIQTVENYESKLTRFLNKYPRQFNMRTRDGRIKQMSYSDEDYQALLKAKEALNQILQILKSSRDSKAPVTVQKPGSPGFAPKSKVLVSSDGVPFSKTKSEVTEIIKEIVARSRAQGRLTYDFSDLKRLLEELRPELKKADFDTLVKNQISSYENIVEKNVVEMLELFIAREASNAKRLIWFKSVEGLKGIREYYTLEYSEPLDEVVVALGDLDSLGVFYPPCAQGQIRIGQSTVSIPTSDRKGFKERTVPGFRVLIPELALLRRAVMERLFGSAAVVFVDLNANEHKSDLVLEGTVAHELRHYVDFKQKPEIFCEDGAKQENDRLKQEQVALKADQKLKMTQSEEYRAYFEKLSEISKNRGVQLNEAEQRDSISSNFDNLWEKYHYYFSTVESRAFLEEARFLHVQKKLTGDEVEEYTNDQLGLSTKQLRSIFKVEGRLIYPTAPLFHDFVERMATVNPPTSSL